MVAFFSYLPKTAAKFIPPALPVSIKKPPPSLTFVISLHQENMRRAVTKAKPSVLDGHVKVGWKVDWALRWYALGVDYEMHGEDLMESGRLSSKIVKVLGGKPPELFKYELFLDETGKKISKKNR